MLLKRNLMISNMRKYRVTFIGEFYVYASDEFSAGRKFEQINLFSDEAAQYGASVTNMIKVDNN